MRPRRPALHLNSSPPSQFSDGSHSKNTTSSHSALPPNPNRAHSLSPQNPCAGYTRPSSHTPPATRSDKS
eukprot:2442036-Rhodomonas_salina.1